MAEKLGLYVHIPFCRSKCDYCDFYSLAGKEGRMDDYQKGAARPYEGDRAPHPGLAGGHRLLRRRHPQLLRGEAAAEVLKTVAKRFDLARTRRLPWSATRTVWIRRCFRPSGGRG